MVDWFLPTFAQGVVTAGAGVTVGYWLFARQRSFHAKDTAAVLVANLNGAHAVLYHVAQPIDPIDSIGRADALKALRSFVDDYAGIMPSIGILGHEIVRRIGRIYAELNILALDIEGVDSGLEAVVGRTQPLSQSIRSDAMKKWFEGSEEVIDQMESDVAALSADICTKFGLPIEVNTALFAPGDRAESGDESKQEGEAMVDQDQIKTQADLANLQLREYYRYLLDLSAQESTRSHTYTAVILFGSYGAIISIWWGLKGIVGVGFSAWSAALIGISILSFIVHELWGVWVKGNESLEMSDAVSRDLNEALKAFEDLQKRQAKMFAAYAPWWRASFLTSLVTGVGAALVLVSGAIAKAGPAFWTLAWWVEILNVAT